MLKIIDLDKLNEVGDLVRGALAFPNLDFSNFPDLELNSTTLLAAYSNISSRVESKFLEGLDWNNKGDIRWQNAKLKELEANINSMILEYQQKPNDFLLVQIFLWIQLWGGNAGRSVFLRGNSWESNFNIDTYKKVINLVEKGAYIDALKLMNTIFGINTAFSTKHIGFWSLTKAPIYDSVIAEIVFGDIVKENDYKRYLHALDDLIRVCASDKITRATIERNLFNWAISSTGIEWRRLRKSIRNKNHA